MVLFLYLKMAFQDKTLQCKDCGKDFVWTADEQDFYNKKGFDNPPARCKECRALKKARFNEGRGNNGPRPSIEITCAQCGKKDTVPFQPKDPSTVLCRDCYRAKRG